MQTVSELIDQVRSTMSGNGGSQDSVSVLTTDIDATSSSFTALIDGSLSVSDGVVEIGSELIYLRSVEQGTGVCTVAPGVGRGWAGTTADTHPANSLITSQPRLPRRDVMRALNNALLDFYPDLFAVSIFTFIADGVQPTIDLDEDCMFVLRAEYQLSEDLPWQQVVAWRLDQPEVEDAPVRFRLPSVPPVGAVFRIAQATKPRLFEAESDQSDMHGIPVPIESLLVSAAVAKLTPNSDLDRLQVDTVEQSSRSRVVPASAAFTAARFLYGPFAQQLASARRALRTRWPVQNPRTF